MNRLPGVAHVVSRSCLAAPFIARGLGYLRDRTAREDLVRKLGYPAPQATAFVDAAAKIGGGLALAAGVRPELSAAALIVNLAPMTVSVHPFWKERDPQKRSIERNAFILNVALAGGLLAVAALSHRR